MLVWESIGYLLGEVGEGWKSKGNKGKERTRRRRKKGEL